MGPSTRDAGPRLRERQQALDVLERLINAARAGDGGAVFCVGEAGVGKSALIDAAGRLAGTELSVRSARGAALEGELAFAFAEQILDTSLAPDHVHDVARAQIREWASSSAVLMVLDDMHWADPDSLRLLDFLVRRLGGLPVAVVGALRPWPPGARSVVNALAHDGFATVLDVAPLSADATGELLGELVGATVPADSLGRAFALTKGNPLLVGEVARSLREQGRLPDAAGRDGAGLRQALLLSHLAGLPPAALHCARAAAALGGRVRLGVVQAVTGQAPAEFADALDTLVRAGVLRDVTGGSAEFSHDLLASALYDDTAPAQRRLLHITAFEHYAELGDVAAAAPHALAADLRGDARAVTVLSDAGVQAITRGAVQVALTQLDAAVELAGTAASDQLLARRADALLAVGRAESALAAYRDLLARPLDTSMRTDASMKLARAQMHTGRSDEALATYDELLRDGGPTPVHLERAHVVWESDGPAGALAALEPAGDDEPVALARNYFRLQAGDPSGLDDLRRAAATGHSAGRGQALPSLHAVALYASACAMTDRLDEGLRLIEHGDESLRAAGAVWSTLPLHITRLGILLSKGDLLGVMSGADDLEEEFELDTLTRPHILLFRARALVWLGRPGEADELCDTVAREDRLPWYAALALGTARGECLLAQRRPDEAAQVFLEVEQLISRHGVGEPCTPRWASGAVEAALSAGLVDQADRVVNWLEQRDPNLPCGWPRMIAAAGRAGIAALRGDADRADEQYQVALALPGVAPLERARVLLRYGSWLRRRGKQVPAARTALAEALRIATDRAADTLAGPAGAELSAAGGRRRSARRPGPLTAQESRVAKLAVTGATTREIAHELHVSPRTVETHLAHAYAKLGIRSKIELRQRRTEFDLG